MTLEQAIKKLGARGYYLGYEADEETEPWVVMRPGFFKLVDEAWGPAEDVGCGETWQAAYAEAMGEVSF